MYLGHFYKIMCYISTLYIHPEVVCKVTEAMQPEIMSNNWVNALLQGRVSTVKAGTDC